MTNKTKNFDFDVDIKKTFNNLPESEIIELVKSRWQLLELVETQTEEICWAALMSNHEAIKYIKNQTKAMCMYAVRADGGALEHVKKQDNEICLEAVKQKSWAIIFVKNQTEEICLAAIESNGLALEHINKKTEEMCLKAVKQNGLALKYVKNQTEEICLAAVKENWESIEYVKKQTEEMCLEMIKGGKDYTLISKIDKKLLTKDLFLKILDIGDKHDFKKPVSDTFRILIPDNIINDELTLKVIKINPSFLIKVNNINKTANIDLLKKTILVNPEVIGYIHDFTMAKNKNELYKFIIDNKINLSGLRFCIKFPDQLTKSAMKNNIGAIKHVDLQKASEEDIVNACSINGDDLGYALHRAWNNQIKKENIRNLYEKALTNNGLAMRWVTGKLAKDVNLCLLAVKQNGMALEYVKYKDERVCLEAFKQNQESVLHFDKRYNFITDEFIKNKLIGSPDNLLKFKNIISHTNKSIAEWLFLSDEGLNIVNKNLSNLPKDQKDRKSKGAFLEVVLNNLDQINDDDLLKISDIIKKIHTRCGGKNDRLSAIKSKVDLLVVVDGTRAVKNSKPKII